MDVYFIGTIGIFLIFTEIGEDILYISREKEHGPIFKNISRKDIICIALIILNRLLKYVIVFIEVWGNVTKPKNLKLVF